MCGIAGIVGEHDEVLEKKNLEGMLDKEWRRGPDDMGTFFANDRRLGRVALGHRRLSILDLSAAGHQPMIRMRRNGGGRLVVSFNGEIYNFLDLRADLEKLGHTFVTQSDTEVILALFDEYGVGSFERLRGMFAFALWDEQAGALFLVRDRYGIKPLYYAQNNTSIAFASLVGALSSQGYGGQKSNEALMSFLLFGYVVEPWTITEGIWALESGSFGVWDGKQFSVQRYFNVLSSYKKQQKISFDDAVGGVKTLLSDSVNKHLISDAPLGVFLSGGLDSSALAVLAAKGRTSSLRTVSVDFDEKKYSEKVFQDSVAHTIASRHKAITLGPNEVSASLGEVFEAMDQPTVDGVNSFFVSRAAKEAGLKVVLSGLGGDEVFWGYDAFRKIKPLSFLQKVAPSFLLNSFGDNLSSRAKLSFLERGDMVGLYLASRGLFSVSQSAHILGVERSVVDAFLDSVVDRFSFARASLDGLDVVSVYDFFEFSFYLRSQLLRDTDMMSMYYSLEVRVPFLDHPLVEYVNSLGADIKLQGKHPKQLLFEAVRDSMPPEIFNRPKQGFTFPFASWLLDDSFINRSGGSVHPLLGQYRKHFLANKIHWSRYWAIEVLGRFV